tara:strand:+ start:77 stop:742 length:666 start_codon:yes stop_codon:yes gene_type:complete
MIFTGQNYRQIGSAKQLSFSISDGNFDNVTGSGTIGFSGSWEGESKTVDFNFISGKIIDPENRYVYSYLPNQIFNISGNIYDENYQYHINDIPICFGGEKDKNIIENFYTDISGCTLTASVLISMDEPSYEFTQGDSFSKQGTYNINIKNNNSSLPFSIFTGEITTNENFLITNLPLRVTDNKNIIVSGTSDLAVGDYEETLSLSTSVGDITNTFNVEVTE